MRLLVVGGFARCIVISASLNVCSDMYIVHVSSPISLFQQYIVLIDQKNEFADGKYSCLKSLNGHERSCCAYYFIPL